jgi:hypothetical protein
VSSRRLFLEKNRREGVMGVGQVEVNGRIAKVVGVRKAGRSQSDLNLEVQMPFLIVRRERSQLAL